MKKLVLTMLIGVGCISAGAEILTPQQALDRAIGDVTLTSTGVNTTRPTLVSTRNINQQPAVYVYSNGQDHGFLVLSADDQTVPVLGFSDSGTFTNEDINPSMQWLLDQYATEIQWLRNNPDAQAVKLMTPGYAQAVAKRHPIAPMCKTTWNQGAPYNNMCPKNGSASTYTGCVATAMAQVMAYHQYPKAAGTGTGSVTYNGTTYSMNFSTVKFDWDNMLDSYSGAYTDAQANAVAQLMYACGLSVSMSYGTSASGAVTSNVATALVDNFGYDKSIFVADRENYSRADWNQFIYEQLLNYGPVQFSGRNSGGGHSFVCDGYYMSDIFHINWGWGGTSDGYFLLTALDPNVQGIGGSAAGYNGSNYVIANVSPDHGGSPAYNFSAGTLEISTTSVSLGSSFTLSGGFYNNSKYTIGSVHYGYALENTSTGKVTYSTIYRFTDLKNNYGKSAISITLPTTTAEGYYRLYPVWKDASVSANMDWQKFTSPVTAPNYINVNVSGTTATLVVPGSAKIEIIPEQFETPVFLGHKCKISGKIKNSSDFEYIGSLFAAIFDLNYNQVAYGSNGYTDIVPGEEIELSYETSWTALTGKTLSTGDYLLAFADENGNIVSAIYNITLNAAPDLTNSKVTINNEHLEFVGDKNNVNPTSIKINVTAKSQGGYYIGQLYAYFFEDGGNGSSSICITSPTVYIPENSQQTVQLKGAANSLKQGSTYRVHLYHLKSGSSSLSQAQTETGSYTTPLYITVGQATGVQTVLSDNPGHAIVSRQLFNLSGVEVNAENPAPGLYIERITTADGQVLTSKISIN